MTFIHSYATIHKFGVSKVFFLFCFCFFKYALKSKANFFIK